MNTQKTRWFHYLILAAILGVALFFRAYNIQSVGYGNLYYASTVHSMLTSLKNFFFVSFDPSGYVSVDKSPLGFWVQALSVSVFGFQGWALQLPQIIAGVLSCLVLYWLVRRTYGPNAGLVAALILTVTPIAVAADRNNTIDAQLVLTLLLSAATLILAVEKNSLKWLLLGAVFIGIGFNIKELQAYMVLPAFYGFYLFAARTTWGKKFTHLAIATAVMFAISFAWIAAVDLTPASLRPYVGSSQNNTETELIVGHNGLERIGQIATWFGLKASGPGQNNGLASQPPSNQPPSNQNGQSLMPPPPNGQGPQFTNGRPPFPPTGGQFNGQPNSPQGPNNGGPMQNETGSTGVFRLFNQQLVGQASWLLPLALFMMLALALRNKWRWPLNQDMQFTLFWGLWLIPMAAFFSYAGLFHRYYLEMLAPAIAALGGAGLVVLCDDFVENRWQGWLLPVAIMASAIFEAAVVGIYFAGWAMWLVPTILLFGAVSALGLILMRRSSRPLLIVALVALLIAPIVWSSTTLNSSDVALPYAGPDLVTRGSQIQPRNDFTENTGLINYLEANYSDEEFLVAASNANIVAPIILSTGKSSMAIGGFSGSDPILTASEFADYVKQGKVRFVLATNDNRGGQEISQWVQSSCKLVDPMLWQGTPNISFNSQGPGPGGPNQMTLYDCK